MTGQAGASTRAGPIHRRARQSAGRRSSRRRPSAVPERRIRRRLERAAGASTKKTQPRVAPPLLSGTTKAIRALALYVETLLTRTFFATLASPALILAPR